MKVVRILLSLTEDNLRVTDYAPLSDCSTGALLCINCLSCLLHITPIHFKTYLFWLESAERVRKIFIFHFTKCCYILHS